MSGVTGDFGRLTGTINALKRLARVPSRVAGIAAPKLQEQVIADTNAQRDPYGRAYAPHTEATIRRWGEHPILNLTGTGIGSIRVSAKGGAGIEFEADEHMRFAQGGTKFEPVRAIFPNSATLPKSWNRILKESTEQAIAETMGGKSAL